MLCPACKDLACFCLQTDINDVNKLAHELKGRLERLHKMNEASLGRKVLLCSTRHTLLLSVRHAPCVAFVV